MNDKIGALTKDLHRYSPDMFAKQVDQEIWIYVNNTVFCTLKRGKFKQWVLNFTFGAKLVGPKGMRYLNGIARAVSRMESAKKATKVQFRYSTGNF